MTRKSVFSILLTATVALGIGLPAMAEWKQTDFLHTSRSGHTATLLPTGKVIVTGGFNSSYLSSAELYDTNTGTWTTTGELATPRHDHTATLLPSGKVLVAGGYNDVDGYLAVAELYDPSTGLWEAIAGLTTPRALHTATLLRTGQVLVAGGYNNVDGYLADGEIFNSNGSEPWQPTGDLNVARMEHTAALLPGGEILVAGGCNGDDELRSAELYVPGNPGAWVSIEPLEVARRRHTATVLADGTVLVAGGENNGSSLSSSQLYEYDYEHPENGIWKPTGDLLPERTGHTATLLPSGKVLAVGGKDTDYIWDAMLYDPSTGSWQGTGVDEGRRRRHTATLLPSGMVLVAGGQFDGGYLANAQLFDPSAGGGSWGSTASLNQFRARHTATLLPSGKVLVAAGYNYFDGSLSSTELYDSSTDDGTWVPTSPLNTKRCRHTATLLASQKVLAAGGYYSKRHGPLRSAELYNPETGEWELSGYLRAPRSSHTATLLPSEKVLVAGGTNGRAYLSSAELYDPSTGEWELTGELRAPRISHTATLLLSGKVLVAGGTNANGYLATAELYDPRAGTWETTGALAEPRAWHTATLLFSGKVLVAGGYNGRTVSSAELYDPSTGTWEMTEELGEQRLHHSATLLPSGKILVTGGEKIIDGTTSYLRTAELYDPRTDAWKTISSLATYRSGHTATVLTSGTVLVAGGENSDSYGNLQSVELYDPAIHLEIRQPGITWASEQIRHGDPLYIEGDDFLGDSEGSSGNTQTSSVNYPLVQLREVESGQTVWLSPVLWSLIENPPPNERLTINNLPPTLNPGSHLLRVVTAGVPSESRIVDFECSLAITRQPIDVTAEIGTTAAFTVAAQGGRYFQWKKNGFDIPGANGPTYTTPPITAGDAGTTYQVIVDSGCMSALSDSASLTVEEYEDPSATVLSPSGGELWLLSTPGDSPRTETITWEMSDNTHICRVEVALFHLEDGTYVEVPGGGLLATFDEGPGCALPGVQAGSVEYTLPTVPPGNVTSQYKIQLQVTDHAGNTTVVLSARPFSIASPNPDAVKTLILANVPRMEVMASISPVDAAELEGKLQDLANHDDVKGFVIHLEDSTNLYPLYAAWDADPGDWAKANAVLFDPQVGIHQVVRQWLGAFPGVEYVIVVGDDRIIPMARIYDRTVLLPEPSYPTDTPDNNSDLTTTGTTVGRALAANRYLSDDLLAVLDPILPDEVDSGTYIPDLALGRLVETPQEIIQAITVFLNQNGILDLTALDPDYGHKVLVTGYDFLIDSAKRVCTQWKAGFGVTTSCPGDELEPIDGKLIGPTWDEPTVEARRQALLTHLGGNGGERYGIANLNGHATHYEAGVPGTDRAHIAGVDAADLYDLDLAGSVLYAVGCHGGLSVAGSDDPFDHPLDLPQTMLAAGVQTYVANTGYGWGLLHGIGFSERLVEIFTARLMEGETVAAGKAVVRAKLGYYLDSFCPDLDDEQRLGPYGEKTIMQWALFGFPMYAVKLGTGSGGSAAGTGLFDSAPGERPAEEHLAGVTVTRELAGSAVNGVSTLPPFLTRLDLRFELAAPGLYTKYNASGDVLGDPFDPIHPPAPGCPDPPGGGPEGCYYTLNGLSTEVADVPIQPYLAYDSRLSGTSAHGLLWKGGTYREEDGWTPVFAQLASNQEQDYTDHGSAPRTIIIRPRALRRRAGSLDGPDCTSADLEVSSIVLATGETLRTPATAIYDVERLYQDVDLEVLYFNNTQGGAGNCDRLGPELLCGSSDDPCHEAVGPTIEWAVPATDDGGVWRVLVVYTDNTVDADGRGTWVPLELTADGTGTWRGSVTFPEVPLVTYVVQAVDLRGNVTWLDYVTSDQPESGVPFDLPETVDVELVAGAADLSVTLAVAPDPVVAGDPLRYTIAIDNLGPDTSISPEAELTLPAGTAFGLAAGDGWSCTEDAGVVFCERETLPIGVAPPITVLAQAPPGSGILIATVEVRAMNDPNTSNNFDTASTRLIDDESTDLAVVKEDGGVPAEPGQPITYSIYVFNHGPSAVNGAGVEDLFPAELHDVVWSCLATVGSSCTPSGVGDIVDEVGLEPQGAVLYTATAIVDVNATGWIANTATVSSPVADRDLANNQSQARTPIRFMMSPTEWKATGDLRDERHRHTATLLPSGKLLVAGGESGGDLSSTELYDPSTGTWESTGGLVTPRHSYTATLLPSGKVLATGGSNAGGHLSSTELYDPSTGTWESIGGLATPRGRHTATLLPAGKVLVTGGSNAGGDLSSAEVYNPSTGTWETTGSFVTPRHAHTATLLPSGKVLIAGGVNAGGYLSSAEVYDPSTGTWETTGSLVTPRDYYTATLLPSGKVLVTGGYNGSYLASAEIYDPGTGTWAATGALGTPRCTHSATLLPSGKVLVAGGWNGDDLSSAEVYDPSTGTWATTGSLAAARFYHTATLLPLGKVVVVGGFNGDSSLAGVEVYDPSAGAWAATGSLDTAGAHHTATLLPSGKVLVAGGDAWASSWRTEVYDRNTGTWATTGNLVSGRGNHTATLLPSGTVLVTGGFISGVTLLSAEVYDPSTETWASTGRLATGRFSHTATLLPSGKVLVAGGFFGLPLPSAEVYNPGTGTWAPTGSLSQRRVDHTATLLPSGKVLVTGGWFGGPLSSAEVYDPSSGTWEPTGSLVTARLAHTATLLPSGKVLVTGGVDDGGSLSSAEIYDPGTGAWETTRAMATRRGYHTATLLPTGKLLVTGGVDDGGFLSSAEVYDPGTATWETTEALATGRSYHTATLLLSGEVVVAGGDGGGSLSSAELYGIAGQPEDRKPVIQSISEQIHYGQPFIINGEKFRGDSEASSGNSQSSAVNYPLIELRELESDHSVWLVANPRPSFWDEPMTLTISNLPPGLNPGYHRVTVFTAGVPSDSKIIHFECSLVITQQPTDQVAAVGATATFSVETQGGRLFQWLREGVAIPGAAGPSYTTPPVATADAGTFYQVIVSTGCTIELSNPATLMVMEDEYPTGAVLSPSGGEYWLLSEPGEPRKIKMVTWEMSDNTHICRARISLLFSDNGSPYEEVPVDEYAGLPAILGDGPGCTRPGVQTNSLQYFLPVDPPSDSESSQYKIQLQVTDHSGNATEVVSPRPFSIARPNLNAVKTLILANIPRMKVTMGLSDEEAEALEAKLVDLAKHSAVNGRIIDLDAVANLSDLYRDWDIGLLGEPAGANAVLFDPGGLHEYLLSDLMVAFPGTEYLLVVGDDRIVPMARVSDRTVLLPEECYTQESCPEQDYYPSGIDLTPNTTTVGQALAANAYLSDDLLAVLDPIDPAMISKKTYIPDLAIGRLVETPQEIIQAITVFLNQNGIVDLTDLDPVDGHKVLVTGYDFLIDSAKRGRWKWKNAFGLPEPHDDDELAPADGQLISRTWDADTTDARRQALRAHLGGNGGARYAITNLNGHATHYEEGVPITDPYDIDGLNAKDIYGPDGCGSSTLGALDLAGSVLYAAGCHAGLPVTGSCATDADHSLDLPQTMLWRGVQGYVANTGFGWGLVDGIGYAERLVDFLTNRFTDGGILVMGKVVAEVKNAYYLSSARPDFDDPERLGPYAEKTVMQWTYFGLPMYAVKVGSTAAAPDRTARLFQGPAREPGERAAEEYQGALRVTRELSGSAIREASSLPSYLTRLDLSFDLWAPGVYTKYNASGDVLGDPADPSDPPDAGCPDPQGDEPAGCYYGLNDLSTDDTDLPIEPFLVYDSRLWGTSQHGVLWKGGTYLEEEAWTPVIARLASNVEAPEYNLAGAPRTIIIRARGLRRRGGSLGGLDCTSVDLEMSSIGLATGETLWSEVPETYDVARLYQDVDLEVFYFNNTVDGHGNCDRLGPEFGDGPFNGAYHHATGPTIEWAIPAYDETDNEAGERRVWRVLVVYTDNTVADGRGAWVPLELTNDGTGTWRGSETFPGASLVTYLIQAVDDRGNVSWVEWIMPDPPPSGVPLGIPATFDVDLTPGRAHLSVALDDEQDPVMAGATIKYTIEVDNGGPDPAILPEVSLALDDQLTDPLAGGDGWTCGHAAGLVTCEREVLAPGPADRISVYVTAPGVAGLVTSTVTVTSQNQTTPAEDTETTLVIDDYMTDLGIVKEDGGVVAVPGGPLTYWITVTNNGPKPVKGATVTDYFPWEVHSVAWSCWATAESSCTQSGNGDIVDIVDLLVGGTLIYTATSIVIDDDAIMDIRNIATVAPPSTMIDYNRENDESVLRTPLPVPGIFADGFESGDLSAWPSARKSPVIQLRDEARDDPGIYRGSFTLGVPEKGAEPRVLFVVDEHGEELLALSLVVEDGLHRLLAWVRLDDGGWAETEVLDLPCAPHVVEIERTADGEGATETLEILIDGLPIPSIDDFPTRPGRRPTDQPDLR